MLADDATAGVPGDGKPAELPTENGDASSAPAEPEVTVEAAEAAVQAEAVAAKRRVFRGMAPPATLLHDLSRCEQLSVRAILSHVKCLSPVARSRSLLGTRGGTL